MKKIEGIELEEDEEIKYMRLIVIKWSIESYL